MEEKEIRKIDNRKPPIMKWQYWDICQLVEYPEIEIKIEGEEAKVYFDGECVDTFPIKGLILDIVKTKLKEI